MEPPWPHIVVEFYYTYKLMYFFWGLGGFILVITSIFLFMGFTPLRMTRKSKYYISVFPKKYLSILNLSPLPSVYLELISTSIHDISSILLIITKGRICTHRKIRIHEINNYLLLEYVWIIINSHW